MIDIKYGSKGLKSISVDEKNANSKSVQFDTVVGNPTNSNLGIKQEQHKMKDQQHPHHDLLDMLKYKASFVVRSLRRDF